MAANALDRYARAVVDGRLPAGRYHRLACVRHLADRAREGQPDFPYQFSLRHARRFFAFAKQLRHYKGEWAGTIVRLTPCQQFRLGSLFGWLQVETGLRRFRTAYNEIPRKNGKTLEAALVALYVTFFDEEQGSEGYCVATKRDQAKLVFNDCKRFIRTSDLRRRLRTLIGNIHQERTASKLEPLGADADSTDGLNPHCVIVDELHAHKTRDLLDVMETATGARRQPVTFQITTAGDDLVSPCGDQHEYAGKILEGLVVDESFFAFIAHADPGDPWQAEATWRKANPHYGICVKPEDLRALALKARNIPAAAAAFQQKRLNLWVNAAQVCLSLAGWRKGQTTWDPATLAHEPCYVGVDLASKIDLCALVAVFPPRPGRAQTRWLMFAWTPAETLADRAHRDRAPYEVWVDQGWLRTTAGSRIDQQVIRTVLADLRQQYDIERIGFDPWHADKLVEDLVREDGFPEAQVLAVPQTFAGMSSACLRVQADILAGEIDARGCPVTAWAVSNAVGQRDGKDNLMFAKGRSRGRIDPLIAGTIGTALWLRQPPEVASVYLTRGVRILGA